MNKVIYWRLGWYWYASTVTWQTGRPQVALGWGLTRRGARRHLRRSL